MLRIHMQDIEPIQDMSPTPNDRDLWIRVLATGVAVASELFSTGDRCFDG